MIRILQKVVEVDFVTASGEKLEFRIEVVSVPVYSAKCGFRARVWRYDAFDLKPSFETDPEFQVAVHIWPILEPTNDTAPAEIDNADEAAIWFVDHLSKKLNLLVSDI